MTKIKLIVLFLVFSMLLTVNVFSQDKVTENQTLIKDNAIILGFLQGGGSLVGVDYERIVIGNLGFQIGAGLVGVGVALNYHFEPTVNSSAFSLFYMSQGMPFNLVSDQVTGVTFVFRGWNWLNAQIGLGYMTWMGDTMKAIMTLSTGAEPPKLMLIYSIGAYFSF